MARITTSIVEIKQETHDVISIHFAKQVDFQFNAGQFLRLLLPMVEPDPRGPSRFFSIASSPAEEKLMIATKLSQSPFKQKLMGMKAGEEVTIEAPFGKFVLSGDTTKPFIFLSGGIGITPFRSILKYVADEKLRYNITLLYSNQTPDQILFKEELDTIAKENPNLTIVHTITRPSNQLNNNLAMQQFNDNVQWKTGRIDETMIKEHIKDLPNALFYICGPPTMVEALNSMVKSMGILDENIKLERFTGYQ